MLLDLVCALLLSLLHSPLLIPPALQCRRRSRGSREEEEGKNFNILQRTNAQTSPKKMEHFHLSLPFVRPAKMKLPFLLFTPLLLAFLSPPSPVSIYRRRPFVYLNSNKRGERCLLPPLLSHSLAFPAAAILTPLCQMVVKYSQPAFPRVEAEETAVPPPFVALDIWRGKRRGEILLIGHCPQEKKPKPPPPSLSPLSFAAKNLSEGEGGLLTFAGNRWLCSNMHFFPPWYICGEGWKERHVITASRMRGKGRRRSEKNLSQRKEKTFQSPSSYAKQRTLVFYYNEEKTGFCLVAHKREEGKTFFQTFFFLCTHMHNRHFGLLSRTSYRNKRTRGFSPIYFYPTKNRLALKIAKRRG